MYPDILIKTIEYFKKFNGIGEKTKDTLIKKFKSVKRIKEQTEEELAEVIGKAKAKIIFDNFHQD